MIINLGSLSMSNTQIYFIWTTMKIDDVWFELNSMIITIIFIFTHDHHRANRKNKQMFEVVCPFICVRNNLVSTQVNILIVEIDSDSKDQWLQLFFCLFHNRGFDTNNVCLSNVWFLFGKKWWWQISPKWIFLLMMNKWMNDGEWKTLP